MSIAAWVLTTTLASAAPRADSTPMPLGSARLNKGTQQVTYRLPVDAHGPLDQGIMFWGIRPKRTAPPPQNAAQIVNPVDPGRAPCDVTINIGGKDLLKWTLGDRMTGYVLHPKLLKENNAQFAEGKIGLSITLDGEPDSMEIRVSSLPELGQLHPDFSGPLADLPAACQDPDTKKYFEALSKEVAGDYPAALAAYQGLAASKNETIARSARRGRRLLKYQTRPFKISGNFFEHVRWGLFAQQCGFHGVGKLEFDECRILLPDDIGSQVNAAEMTELVGAPFLDVQDYLMRAINGAVTRYRQMRAAGEDTSLFESTEWNVLIVILRNREYTDNQGGAPGKAVRSLKSGEITQVKNLLILACRMIQGATEGRLSIVPTTFEIDHESQYPYVNYAGAAGPSSDIIEDRNWFDGVISIRPRIPGEEGRKPVTVSADFGPKGVGLSDVFEDADVHTLTHVLYDQLANAAARNEAGPGLPTGDALFGAGHQPVPNIGYACRSALRYYLTPTMIRQLRMSVLSRPEDHVRFWSVRGEGKPASVVESPTPFVDLSRLLSRNGKAQATAECWAFSPRDQDVMLAIGQARDVAAKVNGRVVREGRHLATESPAHSGDVATVVAEAPLKTGWNQIELSIESPEGPGRWGFSLCLTDPHGRRLTGIAFAAQRPSEGVVGAAVPPEVGPHYNWAAVYLDYSNQLPVLDAAGLRKLTGVADLTLNGKVDGRDGWFTIGTAAPTAGVAFRPAPAAWAASDKDETLNNVLDWRRESCAAFRFKKDGKAHDLLFLKPEAIQAYLTLLNESRDAAGVFGNTVAAERIVGYCLVPAGPVKRQLLVVDTLLGDQNGWPVDEEDLLEPWPFPVPAAAGR